MSPDLKATVRPLVVVSLSHYAPPFEVEPIVRRMLDSVPGKYLAGLAEVALTDTGDLPRNRR